jgi:dihydropyrimidine dehydrogenase (NAD+) subunit PreT
MEQEKIFKMKILTPPSKKIKKHVACIGAGPASLAVAAELAKVGVKVTVFDNNPKAGGVLSYGITSARLPQKVVDQDVAAVKGLGVKFELSKEIGLNIDVNEMLEKKDYDAIFIGTGLWESKKLGIEGEQSLGVVSSIDFLRYAKDRKGVDFIKGQRVLVIGGGDVAMDCASAAVLSGAASTAIWYRRTIAEAPAQIAEIEYVTKLGVGITTGYAPTKITGSSDGLWVEFLGRDGKSTANVNVDCLVTAIGQVPRDHSNFLPGNIDAKGDIIAKKDGSTKIKGVFAAGDIVNGGKTVVEAVAGGKIAAAEILKYLGVEV